MKTRVQGIEGETDEQDILLVQIAVNSSEELFAQLSEITYNIDGDNGYEGNNHLRHVLAMQLSVTRKLKSLLKKLKLQN